MVNTREMQTCRLGFEKGWRDGCREGDGGGIGAGLGVIRFPWFGGGRVVAYDMRGPRVHACATRDFSGLFREVNATRSSARGTGRVTWKPALPKCHGHSQSEIVPDHTWLMSPTS